MCIRFCVNTYFVQVRANSGRVRQRRVVDDDLEVAVRAALVLERVLDLRDGALERREVVLAQFFKAVINERDRLIGRGFLLPCVAWRFCLIRSVVYSPDAESRKLAM